MLIFPWSLNLAFLFKVLDTYTEELGTDYPLSPEKPGLVVTESEVVFGDVVVLRQSGAEAEVNVVDHTSRKLILRRQLPALRSLATAVNLNWLSIVVSYTCRQYRM